MRTMVKRVLQSDAYGEAESAYLRAQSLVDRLAAKGIIHRNKAANYKRQMQRRVHALHAQEQG